MTGVRPRVRSRIRGPRPWALAACLALAAALPGAVYWTAPGGNDGAAGTESAPFATVQHGVNALLPGDTLNLQQGLYHESVVFPKSGTASAPITVQAAPGACPVLDGAQPVNGAWSLYGGAIWRIPWPSQPTQVFCEGSLLNEARWPAAPVEGLSQQAVATADSAGSTSLTCAALPAMDLSGAVVQIMPGQEWCSYSRVITSDDVAGGTLYWTAPIDDMAALVPRRGNIFYVFGKLSLLTSAGEWFWDPAAQELYVWAQDGSYPGGEVEAGTAGWVLTLDNQSYLTVAGLGALGGGFSLHNSGHCIVQNCTLKAPNWTRLTDGYADNPQYLGGGDVSGTSNQWLGGNISEAGRSGLNLSGGGHSVIGVTVSDCGWNWGNDGGINVQNAGQVTVQYCTVQRVARGGIMAYLTPQLSVLDNLIQDVALYSADMGGFYCWGTDGQGSVVAGNTVRNVQAMWGTGIYLDNNTQNFTVENNTVSDVSWYGITFKAPDTVQNNTVLGAGHQAVYLDPGSASLSGATVAGNQLVEPFPVRVSLFSPLVADYGYYGGYAYLTAPGRVEIDWTSIDQPWWAVQIPPTLTQVSAVNFSMDLPCTYTVSISNLRTLPIGGAGDAGAVPLAASWSVSAGAGSSAASILSGPPTWTAGGTSAYGGWNNLLASLPSLTDMSGLRGIAFDIGGGAGVSYALQGSTDSDNGPDAQTGRGAAVPAQVGAAAAPTPACPWSPSEPTASPTPTATAARTGTSGPFAGPPQLFPNPFRPGAGQVLRLGQTEAGSAVDIYDIVGRRVRSFTAVGNPAEDTWDAKNANGLAVVEGVYLVVVRQPSGRKDVLRAAVLR